MYFFNKAKIIINEGDRVSAIAMKMAGKSDPITAKSKRIA